MSPAPSRASLCLAPRLRPQLPSVGRPPRTLPLGIRLRRREAASTLRFPRQSPRRRRLRERASRDRESRLCAASWSKGSGRHEVCSLGASFSTCSLWIDPGCGISAGTDRPCRELLTRASRSSARWPFGTWSSVSASRPRASHPATLTSRCRAILPSSSTKSLRIVPVTSPTGAVTVAKPSVIEYAMDVVTRSPSRLTGAVRQTA